ncbi:MAG: hypothetical protein CM15mP40_09170 [Alphaproteobacteria bacterium]|nr:MAG: hypothetical protein CM15mP40_09170 [Alphaproteobacteria bacterium]
MGYNGLEIALGEIVVKIDNEISNGANIIILSDRGVSPTMAPIPHSLLRLMCIIFTSVKRDLLLE